ncbi:N-methyl-L-tryptophan oxidase [Methylobacterium nodulans]|uniref:FAD dependent oxidoreductase n=1 Tax=Methylobacterium nodulans (strain LMG 21967 / CNCM I-2342 / ORS 2060) TaxID=460265 RepID=B8IUB7_METNO|nr:N-methyl-L-tryptophan oxidase [Methylobacterium nodulans]ACL55162.1 FAD dependent oxidoreductase [Methylobacterium nodulans ORS 2060]
MSQVFDVIVLGVGGMGSATCWHLARRGQRVLGLERFDIPHAMGSSHGVNRIIRLAYFEHPSYVPLLRRAYANWREAEVLFGEPLLFITGSVDAGPAQSRVVAGAVDACRLHDLPHELLPARELNARFPGYALPEGHLALLQPEGGFVASERAIVAHVALAQGAGAEIRARERALGWEPTAAGGVRVRTERGTYEAGRLVLAAGAWMQDFVPALAGRAVPERQVLGWFQPTQPAAFALGRFPVFNALFDEGHFYGFPVWGLPGFKIGLYHHLRETGPAETIDREVHPRDEALLRQALRRYFPQADGPTMALRTCLFTNTPDEHFVLDTLPDLSQVVVASPCSGHGYKFCSVIGEILADLATTGETRFDIGLHGLARLG